MARKKTTTKTKRIKKTPSAFANFVEYLRLGESYTSLVLGIIAVIIATVLILSVIHTRQSSNPKPEVTPTIAQSNSFALTPTPTNVQPTGAMKEIKPEDVMTMPVQTKAHGLMVGKAYTVVVGDNLWIISEKVYGSGYNWVDIAKANNLTDPSDIHVGNKLNMPYVDGKDATVHTADDNMATSERTEVRANTYVIKSGDDLWDIAVRAYGDGYQWVKIAQANNLSNPDIIHVGNTIKIPRN